MECLRNISYVAYYEVILLSRGWSGRIFVLCALLGIGLVQWNIQGSEGAIWPNVAIPYSIPLLNAWLYNILQSFFVIFLGVEFVWRERLAATSDVIISRPVTNIEYLAGKQLAVLAVFWVIGAVSMFIAYGVYLLGAGPRGMYQVGCSLFYFVTLEFPALVFWEGCVLLISRFIFSRGLYLAITLGMSALFFLLGDVCLFGAADPWGREVAFFFSDVTGFPRLNIYLLQRLTFLLLGVGAFFVSVRFMRRLSDEYSEMRWTGRIGVVMVVAGVVCCAGYGWCGLREVRGRMACREVFKRYASYPEMHVSRNALQVRKQSDSLFVISDLVLVNRNEFPVDTLLLYLNPGLVIRKVSAGEKKVMCFRNNQVLLLDYPLAPGDSVSLCVMYEGRIDERVCYPEMECLRSVRRQGTANWTFTRDVFRNGCNFCVVSDNFTFLIPECLWYPVAVPPVDIASSWVARFDFTQFTLLVDANPWETVLSQGETEMAGGKVVYTNKTPLPKLSLCIGRYERERVVSDEVEMELYYFKGHDFWRVRTGLEADVVAGSLRECLSRLGDSYRGGYPYNRFRVVEIPCNLVSFERLGLKSNEFTQPEILFIPEQNHRNIFTRLKRLEKWYPNYEREVLFDMYVDCNIFFNISPMFNEYQGYFFSDVYPGVGELIQRLEVTDHGTMSNRIFGGAEEEKFASFYFRDNGIKELFVDRSLSVREMQSLLKVVFAQVQRDVFTRVSQENFRLFVREFMEDHTYESINFQVFDECFAERFGWSLEEVVQPYYDRKGLPVLLVRDVQCERVNDRLIGTCKVYNPSEKDGVLSVCDFSFSGEMLEYNYVIPAKSCKEVRIVLTEGNYMVSTNLGECLPWYYSTFGRWERTYDERVGMFEADSFVFRKEKGIIVDNEDPGFTVRQEKKREQLSNLFQQRKRLGKYFGLGGSNSERWMTVLGSKCYGEKIRSAYEKMAGVGKSEVEWRAEIPKEAKYDVAVYLPELDGVGVRLFPKGAELNYRIEAEGVCEAICLKPEGQEGEWVSLGAFRLKPGACRVILNDKGGDMRETHMKQSIVADAVKWVEVKDELK